ncbi:MAG TPA: universal stress protein [Deltaproteobacteria bacterium]|nr:universal stress protein [Deltaproteobacteria bacterium]HEU20567.1 universal stress protein [Deltaproteobacteria bacterium]
MYERILYPTDFSDEAVKAVDYIKELKGAGAQEVVILHVIDRRGLNDLSRFAKKDFAGILVDMEQKARGEIRPIEEELKGVGLKVKVRVEKGGPCDEILRVADEEKVSVIIAGSHGKSNIDSMLLGSVSYKLVKRVNIPILVVKK